MTLCAWDKPEPMWGRWKHKGLKDARYKSVAMEKEAASLLIPLSTCASEASRGETEGIKQKATSTANDAHWELGSETQSIICSDSETRCS